ncbi:MAG TPA: STAS domain-containing protein [Prolixibacteraceae bacterium]|nr:STAS domain-containing protein [Prolixibacteraceae bacterium]
MTNLEISHQLEGTELVFRCKGRLDANQTVHLNDAIGKMVREGYYTIALDMSAIEYISSAGIRALVTQYKNLKAVNGQFYLSSVSDNVRQVLNMVGMLGMLTQRPQPDPKSGVQEEKPVHAAARSGFGFTSTLLSETAETRVSFYGEPTLVRESSYTAEHSRILSSGKNHFAFGLGAIGEGFSECRERFGEYLMLGKNVAYLPADGTKKPDYMVSSGQLVASLIELYGIHFEGNFSHLLRFEAEKPRATRTLGDLVLSISRLTGFEQFALVMLAESGGLVGTSLNRSPVGGKKIFSYPEIKDAVNFTVEPAHNRMLTLSAGYFTLRPGEKDAAFVKKITADGSVNGHIHTAVFPYIPLKKTAIDLEETIDYLMNDSELTDILHLAPDTREIVGLGESLFVQGFCWVAPVGSIQLTQK